MLGLNGELLVADNHAQINRLKPSANENSQTMRVIVGSSVNFELELGKIDLRLVACGVSKRDLEGRQSGRTDVARRVSDGGVVPS
jgi:hypothetical protein